MKIKTPSVTIQPLSTFHFNRSQVAIILSSFVILIALIALLDWQRASPDFYSTFLKSLTTEQAPAKSGVQKTLSTQHNTEKPNPTTQAAVESAMLAEDFPQEVPVYDGVITETSHSEVANRKSWTVTIESEKNRNLVVREIQSLLERNSWVKDSELIDSQSTTFSAIKDNFDLVVYVSTSKNISKIQYTITQKHTNNQ